MSTPFFDFFNFFWLFSAFISFLYFITVQSLIFTAFNGFQQHIKKCRHIQNLLFLTYVSTFTVCYLLFIIYRLPLTFLLLFFVFSCYWKYYPLRYVCCMVADSFHIFGCHKKIGCLFAIIYIFMNNIYKFILYFVK